MATSRLQHGLHSPRLCSGRALERGANSRAINAPVVRGVVVARAPLTVCAASPSPAGAPDSEGKQQKKQQQQQQKPSSEQPRTSASGGQSELSRTGKPMPSSTPLRQANRDIMYGVLTIRAVRTLVTYLRETNIHLAGWLVTYMNKNPIILSGPPEEASGALFIKKLLSMPIEQALYDNGIDPMHRTTSGCHVDPRSMAQRILAVRAQLATEFKQDMLGVAADNEDLIQRYNRSALESCLRMAVAERTLPPVVPVAGTAAGSAQHN